MRHRLAVHLDQPPVGLDSLGSRVDLIDLHRSRRRPWPASKPESRRAARGRCTGSTAGGRIARLHEPWRSAPRDPAAAAPAPRVAAAPETVKRPRPGMPNTRALRRPIVIQTRAHRAKVRPTIHDYQYQPFKVASRYCRLLRQEAFVCAMSSGISGDMAMMGGLPLPVGPTSPAADAELRPGQRLAARVLEMLPSGDVLIGFGQSQAVVPTSNALHPGDRVALEVVTGGPRPEFRMMTGASPVRSRPARNVCRHAWSGCFRVETSCSRSVKVAPSSERAPCCSWAIASWSRWSPAVRNGVSNRRGELRGESAASRRATSRSNRARDAP